MAELHPSGFVETGGCNGPTYTRSQPNRESPGILLNEVTDKYVAEFNLPYRNVVRYINEVNNDWEKLTPEQKELVAQSINKMSGKQIEQFANEETPQVQITVPDMFFTLSKNPSDVKVLVEEIHSPSENTKSVINKESLDSMKSELNGWMKDKKYYECDITVWVVLILVLILVLLIGFGVGYNC